jgi:hypothetical protein
MQLPFWLSHKHPKLTLDNHIVQSRATGDYNCVAWALGNEDDWYEPGGRSGTTWPADIADSDGIGPYVQLFAVSGYEECLTDGFEDGFEKIAIYGDDEGFLHAARQLPNGWWASKLGIRHDIDHLTLAVLEDDDYGHVLMVMRRPRAEVGQ